VKGLQEIKLSTRLVFRALPTAFQRLTLCTLNDGARVHATITTQPARDFTTQPGDMGEKVYHCFIVPEVGNLRRFSLRILAKLGILEFLQKIGCQFGSPAFVANTIATVEAATSSEISFSHFVLHITWN
jgi:hypothetical protein